nr:glycosyltransferase family 2 protein [Sporomusa acidovorans]
MCTYNGELYLEEQLDSIRHQTRLPDELIVCDDASQDGTFTILKKFKNKAEFTVTLLRNEKNIGSNANFAKAIQQCSGDLIFLADQDDYWLPQKTETIVKAFQNNPEIGMVFTDAIVTDKNLRPYPYSCGLWENVGFDLHYQKLLWAEEPWLVFSRKSIVTGATMAFRAKWKDIFPPIPNLWVHDEWFAFVLSLVCPFDFLADKLMYYRLHPKQQIGVNIRSSQHSIFTRLRKVIFPEGHRRKCSKRIRHMDEALLYIGTLQAYLLNPDSLSHLQNQLAHWKSRISLKGSPLNRLATIREEIRLGRYKQYSGSNSMALKDFIEF